MENKKLKRGQEIELTISDLAFGGRGISKQDELVFLLKMLFQIKKLLLK